MDSNLEGQYVSKADMAYYNQLYAREHPGGNSFMSTSPVNLPRDNSNHSPYDQTHNEREYYSSREGDYHWDQAPSKNKERFSNLYKNFNIIHTDHLNNHMLNSVMTIQSVEYDNNSMASKHEDDQKLKVVLSNTNTNIGQILTESSREIDKINKMLEEHRRKKATKLENTIEESENKQYNGQYKEEMMNQRSYNTKENSKPKDTILIEDSNLSRTKPLTKANLNINPLNNTAVLKELVYENISTKNSSAKRATEFNENYGKKSSNQTLFRQASSGKLTGNKPRINAIGTENKPVTPVESASKVSSTKNNIGQKYGEIKSPKAFIAEKPKSKSLNKEKNSSRLREANKRREDEEAQNAPKTSKYSATIAKNSKREKENEEIFQKLTIQKQYNHGSEYSKNQEIAIKQLKSMKEASQEPRTPQSAHSGNRDRTDDTPHFKNKIQQKLRRDLEGMEKKVPVQYSQRKTSNDDYHMKGNNMRIATGGDIYKEILNRESIPSSVKSQRTINLAQDLNKLKAPMNVDLRIDVDAGTNELISQDRRESIHSRNKEFNQSLVQTTSNIMSRNPLTPNSKSTEPGKKVTSPTRSQISQENTIKIYNRILSNPLYHSVETQKGAQVDEHKLEIIKNNLARLQKEYLLISGQRRAGRHCDYGIESTLNINTNPQLVNIHERLSKTSKHSNELERLSNFTTQSSSKGTTTASQESLMKSFLLRQNLLNAAKAAPAVSKSPHKVEQYNFESPKREIQGNNIFQQNKGSFLSSQGKNTPEDEIYNRNNEWLSNKKNKLENMSSAKEKEEMKECTFRPFIYSKSSRTNTKTHHELNGHFSDVKLAMARSGNKTRGNGIAIESPRHDSRVLQTEPSSRNKKGQTATYRQMHESKKSQNIYLDESLSNYSNKVSYMSSKKG